MVNLTNTVILLTVASAAFTLALPTYPTLQTRKDGENRAKIKAGLKKAGHYAGKAVGGSLKVAAGLAGGYTDTVKQQGMYNAGGGYHFRRDVVDDLEARKDGENRAKMKEGLKKAGHVAGQVASGTLKVAAGLAGGYTNTVKQQGMYNAGGGYHFRRDLVDNLEARKDGEHRAKMKEGLKKAGHYAGKAIGGVLGAGASMSTSYQQQTYNNAMFKAGGGANPIWNRDFDDNLSEREFVDMWDLD